MRGAVAVERGCGVRVKGGIYAEITLEEVGVRFEAGIVDPPIPVDPDSLGLTHRGVQFIDVKDADGQTWPVIIDWVGMGDYPNVLDFLEEGRRFGISRRLPSSLDFSQVSADVQLLLVHSRAHMNNPEEYWPYVNEDQDGLVWCPKSIQAHREPEHRNQGKMCASLWWEDVVYGVKVEPDGNSRVVKRTMPSFQYMARSSPITAKGSYSPAVFFRYRISRIVVIRDHLGGTHEKSLTRAVAASGIPVDLVDE
jgi:hypothetical protein